MNNFAIRAENISKHYRIEKKQKYTMLRDTIQDAVASGIKNVLAFSTGKQRQSGKKIIRSLDHVSFEIKHGESIGIIGANGAGKSTLLKILARITAPTEGRVRLRGRVGSLLEVGTGFHSELTGRENVYLNGAVLGMRKNEIDRKFDEIVNFSGVEEFIDTPVKRYSSGMRMRLAFSVAAHLEPEILLVDEVLAVGDVAFQNKSIDKMEKVTRDGRTVLFVSHNLAAVKSLCPQSIFLENGVLKFMGNTDTAIQMYLQNNEKSIKDDAAINHKMEAQILNINTYNADGTHSQTFPHDQPIHAHIKVHINITTFKTHLTLNIYTADLETLLSARDFEPDGNFILPSSPGTYEFQVQIPANFLTPGKYYLGSQISAQTLKQRIRTFDKLDHAAEFEIYDNGSLLSQLSIPWQGSVHIPLKWKRIK